MGLLAFILTKDFEVWHVHGVFVAAQIGQSITGRYQCIVPRNLHFKDPEYLNTLKAE